MEQLYEVILKMVIEAAELEEDVQIGCNDSLDDYDVDSLAGLEITVNLEKKSQIKIPPDRYQDMTNIHAIAGIVTDLLNAKTALNVEVS